MATEKIIVPDFGTVQEITVVDVYVSIGDQVEVEDALIALESEKAVMDIPSPVAGVIKEIYLQEEEVVRSGEAIALIETDETDEAKEATVTDGQEEPAPPRDSPEKKSVHATPSIRAYARKLGVELSSLVGTGPKGRIQKEDVIAFEKNNMAQSSTGTGAREGTRAGLGPFMEQVPLEDFSKYGEIEEVPLGRIKKVSGPHLHRSWVSIPHVTHFDEADVTELESFREQMNKESEGEGIRYSSLGFIVKAVVATLKQFPLFNCSLVPGENKVILKHFYNIGIAVDTPQGLVVPVIKDAEKKGLKEIAIELKGVSQAARDGKLAITDMQGATFTISSLGGIGGTGFTPIVNGPQVAILGLSRNFLKPVWDRDEKAFVPRLTLPFSLSYDHRVIDGAEAARFCKSLGGSIQDLRRALI